MRFIVKNFGSIERADITLKDLNIFIGKNSSGKSYLTYLIWALLSVEPDWKELITLFEKFIPNELVSETINEKSKEKLHELEYKFKNLLIEVFKKFDEIWGQNLEELLKNAFLVDNLDKLIKVGCDKAEITVSDDEGDKTIHIEINEYGLTSWINEVALKDLEENVSANVSVFGEHLSLTLNYIDPNKYTYTTLFKENQAAVVIIPVVFMWIFDDYTPYTPTFIAPDGRTGLIRSIEAYKYALMGGRVAINEVDRKFMRDFETLYPKIKNKEICKFADFIEEKLNVKYILGRELPRYLIQIEDVEVPIQRAPSGYREVAPIIYFMRFALDEEHVIFIEEPEAHLHPDAQVIITRALAGLSKYCYVILTTHSITVLDEISNLLKIKKLSSEAKNKLKYEDWEGLSPENVGMFLFSNNRVEELEVYEDGIEESDLDRIIIEIANLHAKVEEEYEHTKRMQTQ